VLWKGQSLINREEKIIRSDGEVRWLLTTKVPWRDSTGKIIGLVGIGRDIIALVLISGVNRRRKTRPAA